MMTEIQKVPAPDGGIRVESGPVQFGEDWPGVFLRGDDAVMVASTLAFLVAEGMSSGRTALGDFALYGFLLGHARALAACDLSGLASGKIDEIIARMRGAAALMDAPAPGGVQ